MVLKLCEGEPLLMPIMKFNLIFKINFILKSNKVKIQTSAVFDMRESMNGLNLIILQYHELNKTHNLVVIKLNSSHIV